MKGLDVYVPRDEKFGHLKMSDFLGYALKSLSQDFVAGLESIFDKNPNEFDSFQDELDLYEGGVKLPESDIINKIKESIPFEFLKAFLQSDGAPILKFPMPDVIKGKYNMKIALVQIEVFLFLCLSFIFNIITPPS